MPEYAIAQYLGLSIDEFAPIISDLNFLNICEYECGELGLVTLKCRRMIREERQRNQTYERVKRHRSAKRNANVTPTKRRIYQKSEVRSHISEEDKKNKKSPSAPPFVLPDWIKKETWESFEESRRKHPLTDRARALIVKELEKIKAFGHDPNECLERSIRNGWRDVFAPKNGVAPGAQLDPAELERIRQQNPMRQKHDR